MQSFLYRSSFRTDVPEILKAIDIYCLPSLWEGLSIALLEAMAMEKAIIATHTDGTIELIEDKKNGIIVPFYDNDALANAMNLLAEEENMRYRLGKEARKQVENAKETAKEI
jgi:glycosyltransferase involved in cell wall biosynthesis